MILQSLTTYYETLVEKGQIAKLGWGISRVSYGLEVNDSGEIIALFSLKTEVSQGKKTVLMPQSFEVPMPEKRSVNISSNFLCDNATYLFGIAQKEKKEKKENPERAKQCFQACADLHQTILQNVHTAVATAIKTFFSSWHYDSLNPPSLLQSDWEELRSGSNILLFYDKKPVSAYEEIRNAWQQYYDRSSDDVQMPCLVTGKLSSIPAVHPAIRGVAGAQSVGAALVSFNAPSFESFLRTQNTNAPIGNYAAFAYTTALNHLLSSRDHRKVIGDTTVVCWAQTGEEEYQEIGMMGMMNDVPSSEESEGVLKRTLTLLARGESVRYNDTMLHPSTTFYILGIAPNAARLSIRFFLQNSFGDFASNMAKHIERLSIVRPSYEKFETLPLWHLLQETVNQNSRDKAPSPQLAGDMLRAILTNTRYPSTLLTATNLRIRAERTVTRGRAAILKAYYLQNPNPLCPEEVLTVALNEQSTNIPYTLGRLFSVLEAIQETANPGINTTIKDKYFNSASSTPSTIFPVLINLAQKHLRKLDIGKKVFYDKQLQGMLSILPEEYPTRMILPQQGAFQLGYYHQTQKRYEKKEEK